LESDDIVVIVAAMLGCIMLLAIVVGLFVARRRQQQGDTSITEAAIVPKPVGNVHAAVQAASDDLTNDPSSAMYELPVTRMSYHNPAYGTAPDNAASGGAPLRQRSTSYESAIDKLGLGDRPDPPSSAMAQVQPLDGIAVPEAGADGLPAVRMTVEPDSADVPDCNGGYIHTLPGTPRTVVHPLVNLTAESAAHAAMVDYEIPSSIASVANPGSRPPASGPEEQCAAWDYNGVARPTEDATYDDRLYLGLVEPVEDHTYEEIPAHTVQTFEKHTLERKMQLGADGGIRLASVHRTNPLAANPTPAAGTESIAPTIHEHEYEYAEMSEAGAEAI